jgi:hypothetical protein
MANLLLVQFPALALAAPLVIGDAVRMFTPVRRWKYVTSELVNQSSCTSADQVLGYIMTV